jgi:hypothetical protein
MYVLFSGFTVFVIGQWLVPAIILCIYLTRICCVWYGMYILWKTEEMALNGTWLLVATEACRTTTAMSCGIFR